MSSCQISSTRVQKVKKIFQEFDANRDGGLNREEMAALVIAVNPRVNFSKEQITAILNEVFRTYGEFIDGDSGLTFEGLLRTYNDGAGDVDRDFIALGLELDINGGESEGQLSSAAPGSCSSSMKRTASTISEERAGAVPTSRRRYSNLPAWVDSPNNGIAYDDSWQLVEDLEIIIEKLATLVDIRKQKARRKGKGKESAVDLSMDWSRDLGLGDSFVSGVERVRRPWEEVGPRNTIFQKELASILQKADASKTQEEAFDAHMAIGRTLFYHGLYKESLVSFTRATELKPIDVRSHFQMGNTLYFLGRFSEAKEAYRLALDVAEITGSQWTNLIPQIHVNLGIALEGEGMLLGASEHYKEAAIREPKHFRALKLLGSALYGVAEYRAAEKALGEAIYLKPDYADAHCDLGSTLHAMQDDEKAIQEFQTSIDLRPDHMDALYNFGGLFMDIGRYQRAAEMYSKVLALKPDHWRAQLNKAVSLLGAGEIEEARKAFKEAFRITNRVELYDAIIHFKRLEKGPYVLTTPNQVTKQNTDGLPGCFKGSVMIVEPSRFRRATARTTPPQTLSRALDIRNFQKRTRLYRCDVANVMKELSDSAIPLSTSGGVTVEKFIRKEELEKILRHMLLFLNPETFQGAVKAINERILSVLDETGSGRVDLGMLFALLSPICAGPLPKRKRIAFDTLFWRSSKNTGAEILKADASLYIGLLHAIYLPSQAGSDRMELHGEDDQASISYPEFLELFDDPNSGFGVLSILAKLETSDRVRHTGHTCAACAYPIIGPRFKEVTSNFSLCSFCYSEGKVHAAAKQDAYCFKEYNSETEAVKDMLLFFRSRSSSPSPDS
eukprot:c19034_g1_i1 orf=675-3197(+)